MGGGNAASVDPTRGNRGPWRRQAFETVAPRARDPDGGFDGRMQTDVWEPFCHGLRQRGDHAETAWPNKHAEAKRGCLLPLGRGTPFEIWLLGVCHLSEGILVKDDRNSTRGVYIRPGPTLPPAGTQTEMSIRIKSARTPLITMDIEQASGETGCCFQESARRAKLS